MRWFTPSLALPILFASALASAAETPVRSAPEVQSSRHSRLDGKHFTAEIEMRIERDGRTEDRRLLVWRDDEEGKRERILARFLEPADLKDFGLLFVENEGRPNDYFVHQPELARVRRVSESVASQDIYGVDLDFLGFGVAQSVRCEAVDLERSSYQGRPAYRLSERALDSNQRFDERIGLACGEARVRRVLGRVRAVPRGDRLRVGRQVAEREENEIRAERHGELAPQRERLLDAASERAALGCPRAHDDARH